MMVPVKRAGRWTRGESAADRCRGDGAGPRGLRLHGVRARRDPQAHGLGLGLQGRVLDHRHARAQGVLHPPGLLLHHVGQLVAEQLLALRRLRVVLPGGEVEVGADGEGQGPRLAASWPTWTRTSAKLVPKKDSIFCCTASGSRWPRPEGGIGIGAGRRRRAAGRLDGRGPGWTGRDRRRHSRLRRREGLDRTGSGGVGGIGWGRPGGVPGRATGGT